MVGDLAYNPERIYAFEETGHKLYGLWSKPAFCYSTIGKLPFGHVEDIPYENWKERIREIKPDIIYGQISTGAISLAYEVLKEKTGIPFVWHYKESPHEAMKVGLWNKLTELYRSAEGKIYLNEEEKKWIELFIPDISDNNVYILDPELPKREYFKNDFSEKLSSVDGAVHTVFIGRIIGISPNDVYVLANNNIHVHVYNQNYVSDNVLTVYKNVAPKHFHIHKYCNSSNWVKEFSKYDAGWLHCFESHNKNSVMRLKWPDLNLPARINTFMAAGIPIIQKDNSEHIVAMQTCIQNNGAGIFFKTIEDVIIQLRNKELLDKLKADIYNRRLQFSYDYYIPDLIEFFYKIIRQKNT
ncbi:MAG: hypothetical protein LBG92_09550 [Prevotellaceae bacterium]|jgi:hypothetical protein|nr:hypothetical protein [Prevotellaceae bacterium]